MTSSIAVKGNEGSERAANRFGATERLELLCDPGSFRAIRSGIAPRRPTRSTRSGDGVVGGFGSIDGRGVACYAQDVSHLGGALGGAHAETIQRVMDLARRSRMPIVSFIESGGARLQEGTAALGGYGKVFRRNVLLSRIVPQVSIIGGISAGGGCYSPALTDFVVMTEDSAMFLTGPSVVREATGEEITTSELGGHRLHSRNGVCEFVAGDDESAANLVRGLLGYLPQHFGGRPPLGIGCEPEFDDPGARVPQSPRKVYDMGDVVRCILDAGVLSGGEAALGAQRPDGARPARGAACGSRRQPAAPHRRRARRRGLPEGGPVRRAVRCLRAPPDRSRRHPRLHAWRATGAGGGDPLWRLARASLLGSARCRV